MTPTGTASSLSGSVASLRSPLSPSSGSSSSITPFSPGQSAVPQGKMLARAEWHPDASTLRCSYRDCTALFPPVRASPPSASGSAAGDATAGQKGGLRALSASLAHLAHNPLRYHRRHHCRACGRIYCAAHSSNTLPLEVADEDRDCLGAPGLPSAGGAAASADAEQQGSQFIARITGRKGSWTPGVSARGAGAGTMLTPPLSADGSPSEHYFAGAGASAGLATPTPAPAPVVNARVCDDCHVSLIVAASLASINQAAVAQLQLQGGRPSPPLAHGAAIQLSSPTVRRAQSRVRTSAPVSVRHSPVASTSTSPSATTAADQDQAQDQDQRARQESGDSLASATSSACPSTSASSSAVSVETAGTTPPSTRSGSGKASPRSPVDASGAPALAHEQGRDAPASTVAGAAVGEDAASPSMAEQYGVPQRLAADAHPADQVQTAATGKQQTQAQGQQQYSHARVAQLAGNHNHMHVYGEGNPGISGPPGSLESSIGSTPGAGWTWST